MKNNEEETKTVQKIVEIKSLDDRINDLIEMGKEKKYVTFEQIVESLKGLDVDNDSLDKIYNELMENDYAHFFGLEECVSKDSYLGLSISMQPTDEYKKVVDIRYEKYEELER